MRCTIVEYIAGCILLVLVVAALTACAPTPPVVQVPVIAPCVRQEQIGKEPEHVLVTGGAKHDASVLASGDLKLRAWGRELNALLVGCAN